MICRVLGSADCQLADVAALDRMVGGEWPGLTVAVNDAGVHWSGRLDGWCSVHGGQFHHEVNGRGDWLRRREEAGHEPALAVFGHMEDLPDDILRHPQRWPGGSSGLYAVDVALHALGARRVVLCGVPMDARPNLYRGELWRDALRHRHSWEKARPGFAGRVRSMSGWTRELLGPPTLDWLGRLAA